MDNKNLEIITQKEKPIRVAERFLRIVFLVVGVVLKISAWYIGFYQAGGYAFQSAKSQVVYHKSGNENDSKQVNKYAKKAVKSHAIGYIPGTIGSILIGLSGFSYLKDFLRKGRKICGY